MEEVYTNRERNNISMLFSSNTYTTRHWYRRPFPSSRNSHSDNETKCKIFLVKMGYICVRIKNHFRTNGFALSLALKQTLQATWKWPISHFEVDRETGSVFWRIAPWECFGNDGWFDWLLLSCDGNWVKIHPESPIVQFDTTSTWF